MIMITTMMLLLWDILERTGSSLALALGFRVIQGSLALPSGFLIVILIILMIAIIFNSNKQNNDDNSNNNNPDGTSLQRRSLETAERLREAAFPSNPRRGFWGDFSGSEP